MSSSSDNNITFKKTSFLSGINSEFINQFYSDYLSDPKSLPKGWRKFFDGLSEDEKIIFKRFKWSKLVTRKKIKNISNFLEKMLKIEKKSDFEFKFN